jgi:hypothetical protein
MALNNITTVVQNGGLGRVDERDDNVSALIFNIAAPSSYTTTFKGYHSLREVETDGITKAHATYGSVWYHASEYFRQAPGALLYLCFNISYPSDLVTLLEGKVKQVGVFFTDFATLASLHQVAATALDAAHAPISIIAGYDGTLNLGSALDLSTINCPNISVVVFGTGSGLGMALATSLGKTYTPAVGTVLGATARAKVNESTAWVEQFNLTGGGEFTIIRLASGANNPSDAVLSNLNDKRYIVGRKFVGLSGVYLNDNHTASAITNNDYAYLNDVRVMNKVKRELYKVYLPKLNSPLRIDAITGKLETTSITSLKGVGERALNALQALDEISGFEIYIDASQDVLATSTLMIEVRIVVNGIARNIVLNLGLTTKLGN